MLERQRHESDPPVPKILAIDDILLYAPPSLADEMHAFYVGELGLRAIGGDDRADELVLVGWPRSGPRIIVRLSDEMAEAPWVSNRLMLQATSLEWCANRLADHQRPFMWSRGWSVYDRRLIAPDPAGYRVEIVSIHAI